MIRFAPILLAIIGAILMFRIAAWRSGKNLDAQSTPLKDPTLLALTKRMAAELDVPRLKVHIYEIDPINGLAAADGRIFITRGFMNKYRDGIVDAEELASVIAHELGHVALGHSKRRMLDFAGANAIRVVLMTVIGRIIPFIGVYIVNALVSMLTARLSRQDEYEADAYASALLSKAGIGVAPQIAMFQKLDYLAGKAGGDGQLAWLMSHPKTEDRIAAIKTLDSKWKT
ncbi:MAG: M48 family metallopeptidase [Paracoccaceae bacterium]|jgi:putative metalloprotease